MFVIIILTNQIRNQNNKIIVNQYNLNSNQEETNNYKQTTIKDRKLTPYYTSGHKNKAIQCISCPDGSFYSFHQRKQQTECLCLSSDEIIHQGECKKFPKGKLDSPRFSLLSGTYPNETLLSIQSDGKIDENSCDQCKISLSIQFLNSNRIENQIFSSLLVHISLINDVQISARTELDEFLPSDDVVAHFYIKPRASSILVSPDLRGSIENPLLHPINVFLYTSTPNCSIYFNLNDIPVTVDHSLFVYLSFLFNMFFTIFF